MMTAILTAAPTGIGGRPGGARRGRATGQRRRSRAITGLQARLGGRSWGRRRWPPRPASRGHRQPPRREHLADILAEVVGGADPTPLLLALHQAPPQKPAEPRVARTA